MSCFKNLFLLTTAEKQVGSGSGSVKSDYGSGDPDPQKILLIRNRPPGGLLNYILEVIAIDKCEAAISGHCWVDFSK
jgi:hypothetical protein